jgi:hypothetical protein
VKKRTSKYTSTVLYGFAMNYARDRDRGRGRGRGSAVSYPYAYSYP